MAKRDLEIKVRKAILKMEKEVIDINNLLKDLNMKLSHIIKDKRSYYDMLRGNGYTS